MIVSVQHEPLGQERRGTSDCIDTLPCPTELLVGVVCKGGSYSQAGDVKIPGGQSKQCCAREKRRNKSFSWRLEKQLDQGHKSVEFIKREARKSGSISTKARKRDWARFTVWNKVSSGLNLIILAKEHLSLGAWHRPSGWGGRQPAQSSKYFLNSRSVSSRNSAAIVHL